jgi:molybdate transport system regulatory protein
MFAGLPGCKLKVRLWVERHGERVLGPGRFELLGLIDRHQSISAAAKRMNMSYRRAWGLVRSINEAAGVPLVKLTTGGVHGGGAELTPRGKQAIALYEKIIHRLVSSASMSLRSHAGK